MTYLYKLDITQTENLKYLTHPILYLDREKYYSSSFRKHLNNNFKKYLSTGKFKI